MIKTDNGYFENIPALGCRPALRNVLRDAYHAFAIVEVNGLSRMISHHPMMHAPATKLPWPLSKFAMHGVEITNFQANGEQLMKRFKKGEIDEAIEEFLSGVPPNQEVQVNVEVS